MWKANAVQSAIRRGSKLVATIGPASTNPQVLRNLIREGGAPDYRNGCFVDF